MRSYGVEVGPNPMTDVLRRKGRFMAVHTDKHEEKTDADIGVVQLQSKEYSGFLTTPKC